MRGKLIISSENVFYDLKQVFLNQKIREFLRNNSIPLVYLFGSASQDTITPISDIDIAVVFDKQIDDPKLKVITLGEIEDLLNSKIQSQNQIQITELEFEQILFAFQIVHNGKILYNFDEDFRISVECRVSSRYFDFRPLIDVQNSYALKTSKD